MLNKIELPEVITCVKWSPAQSMVAVSSGPEVYVINPMLGKDPSHLLSIHYK